jgi:hypothetical protein
MPETGYRMIRIAVSSPEESFHERSRLVSKPPGGY